MEPFIERLETKVQGKVRLKCCQEKRAFNSTRLRQHLMKCYSFRRKWKDAYEQLKCIQMKDVTTLKSTEGLSSSPEISPFIHSLSRTQKERVDRAFAEAIIKDGMPFSACQNANWEPFWQAVFGEIYRPPRKDSISSKHLQLAFDCGQEYWMRHLSGLQSLCVSVDGFTDVNSKSVFNYLVGGPVPLHVSSFRLGSQRESAVNVDKKLHQTFLELTEKVTGNKVVYGLVTDSPNLMLKVRRLAIGLETGGSSHAVFAYGCSCHAISLFTKDLLKLDSISPVFKNAVKVAAYFKNTHLANVELTKVRQTCTPRPKTIKSFSATRWNGVSEMFSSILENKFPISSVMNTEKLKLPSNALLNVHTPGDRASDVYNISQDPFFWSKLERVVPLFNLVTAVVTYQESDLTPVSMVPLAFCVLKDACQHYLDPMEYDQAVSCLKDRFSRIASSVYFLALVLDPCISTGRLGSVEWLLPDETLISAATAALDRDCEANGVPLDNQVRLRRLLVLWMGSPKRFDSKALGYHPRAWWNACGVSYSNELAPVAARVFGLFSSSAGPERSFKIRSRVHGKSRNRLSNDRADMQSAVIYNSNQMCRIKDGVEASERNSKVEKMILAGFMSYRRTHGLVDAESVFGMGASLSEEVGNDDWEFIKEGLETELTLLPSDLEVLLNS